MVRMLSACLLTVCVLRLCCQCRCFYRLLRVRSLCRVAVVVLTFTLLSRVQGGQGNILQSLESAVRSISGAVTSVVSMNGINSAAYAVGAVGAAFAACTDWTQLTDGFAMTAAGHASQAWPGQMIAATSVFATIVLLVLKVRMHKHHIAFAIKVH